MTDLAIKRTITGISQTASDLVKCARFGLKKEEKMIFGGLGLLGVAS
jgi:hypothetical protein